MGQITKNEKPQVIKYKKEGSINITWITYRTIKIKQMSLTEPTIPTAPTHKNVKIVE